MTEFLIFLIAGFRLSIPLMFGAIGGLLCERSGVIQLGIEAFMLMGAFTAAAVAAVTGSGLLGLLAGLISGLVLGAFFGWLCVKVKANQIIVGISLNLVMMGLIPVLSKAWLGISGSTPSLTEGERLDLWPFFLFAILLFYLIHWISKKTVVGLRWRAAGEGREAAEVMGVSTQKIQFWACVLAGAVIALGGIFLSTAHGSQYARNMISGRGFIALAAIVLGGWRPLWVLLACFVFGMAEASQILLQGIEWAPGKAIPVSLIQMFPYLATVILLLLWGRGHQAPRDLGR